MNYLALFVNFDKSSKICNFRLLQFIGGALWVNMVNNKWNTDFEGL